MNAINDTPKRKRGEGALELRGGVWGIRYYVGGRRVRKSAHSTKRSDAVKLLQKQLNAAAEGRHIGTDVARVTFEDLKAGLVNRYKLDGRRSLARAERALATLGGTFAGAKALSITSARVSAYMTTRMEAGAAPASVHYEIAVLKRAVSLAVLAGQLPAKLIVENVKVSNARQGFFTPAEFAALRAALPVPLRPVVTFAYLTGWRVDSEILPLTWDRVDLKAGEVRLESGTTKNGEGRVFPIAALPELAALLQEQRDMTDLAQRRAGQIIPFVFHREGKPIKSFRAAWAGACKRASLVGRIPHDFRRTAVRNLERAGVPRSVAMQLVGHKTESIYRRYAIVAAADLRDGVAKLAALHGQPAERRDVLPFPLTGTEG